MDPTLQLAAGAKDIGTFVDALIGQIRPLGTLFISLGLIYFITGLVKVLWSAGDEAKLTEGKQAMIWGIVGVFVMVAVWGLVTLLLNTLGITSAGPVDTTGLGLP